MPILMTTVWGRTRFWLIAWCALVAFHLISGVLETVFSHDPSAGAWIGFLPYIVPLLFWQSSWIWLLAAFTEIVIIVRR